MNTYIASIPYAIHIAREAYYHTIFYIIISLTGIRAAPEVPSSLGNADLIVETNNNLYVIEIKIDKPATIALKQIKEKRYYEQFLTTKKSIVLVGISFDTENKTISDWMCEHI